ncbi:acyltransferase family protein [Herbiconiux sp. P17]|uniref:acyltransferase family protein n=1 Tax=Herbiconiux wuyangfengii TaxID=3342794 RepID=UPI0035B90D86
MDGPVPRSTPRIGPRSGRIIGLDVARGLALIGMLFAHTVPETDAETVFDGRSSILFAVIAGVSLGLMTGGRRGVAPDARGRAARIVALRGLLLITLGVALTAFDTPIAIILDTYGFLFLLAVPLLYAPRWLIATVAAAATLLGPLAVTALNDAIDGATGRAAVVLDSAWLAFPERWLDGTYPAPVWLAYIAIGLLIARSGIRRPAVQLTLVTVGGIAAISAYAIAAVTAQPVLAHDDSTAEVIASGGVAVAVIGALVWLSESTPERMRTISARILWPISSAGSMPLTVYSAQIVVIWLYIENVPHEGLLGWQNLPLFFALAVPTLVVTSLWRLRFEQGPLEWLVSRVTTQRPWQKNPPRAPEVTPTR